MKIVVRDQNGAEHTFEGTDAELSKAADLIPGFIDGFIPQVGKSKARRDGRPKPELDPDPLKPDDTGEEENATGDEDAEPEEAQGAEGLSPTTLLARLQEVNAKTDIERVAVIAQACIDAGLPGLDYATVEDLYKRMGLRMPGKWRSTFSNAQTRGYIYNKGRGVWVPTSKGYNLARLGQKQPRKSPRKRTTSGQRTESLPVNGAPEDS